jgi:hypothetical protein
VSAVVERVSLERSVDLPRHQPAGGDDPADYVDALVAGAADHGPTEARVA